MTGPFADGYLAPEPAGAEGGSFDVKSKRANLLGDDGKGRVSLSTMREYVLLPDLIPAVVVQRCWDHRCVSG